ncbi:hypothetical protein HK100_007743 [Physocladia obscura]|uniref:Uncharacterized protein n=1 Tax=Physocladia obscura TaxID=109957 RepID=A0AAD5XAL9_9FUNG|nr:hypothetical protein HK100_007743 [Physocladia obscura]
MIDGSAILSESIDLKRKLLYLQEQLIQGLFHVDRIVDLVSVTSNSDFASARYEYNNFATLANLSANKVRVSLTPSLAVSAARISSQATNEYDKTKPVIPSSLRLSCNMFPATPGSALIERNSEISENASELNREIVESIRASQVSNTAKNIDMGIRWESEDYIPEPNDQHDIIAARISFANEFNHRHTATDKAKSFPALKVVKRISSLFGVKNTASVIDFSGITEKEGSNKIKDLETGNENLNKRSASPSSLHEEIEKNNNKIPKQANKYLPSNKENIDEPSL